MTERPQVRIDAEAHAAACREAKEAGTGMPKYAGADLVGANLAGTDLSGAALTGADLRWANLAGTDLSGADLTGCKR